MRSALLTSSSSSVMLNGYLAKTDFCRLCQISLIFKQFKAYFLFWAEREVKWEARSKKNPPPLKLRRTRKKLFFKP